MRRCTHRNAPAVDVVLTLDAALANLRASKGKTLFDVQRAIEIARCIGASEEQVQEALGLTSGKSFSDLMK